MRARRAERRFRARSGGQTAYVRADRGRALVGLSAFAERGWRGGFYPADLPVRRLLEFYATRLPSVEVNSTFYGLPREPVLRRWAEAVPGDFRFTLKATRSITHVRPLEPGAPLERFLEVAAALGPRLGAVLFLLPPWLPAGAARLASFLERLPRGGRFACEFRHPSWRDPEIARLLAAHGVARCGADTDGAPADPAPGDGFVYLRLRRARYSAGDLDAWAGRIEAWLASGLDVYCYVKHDETEAGPRVALDLRRRLEAAPSRTQGGRRGVALHAPHRWGGS